jgi:hypothetical protein
MPPPAESHIWFLVILYKKKKLSKKILKFRKKEGRGGRREERGERKNIRDISRAIDC